ARPSLPGGRRRPRRRRLRARGRCGRRPPDRGRGRGARAGAAPGARRGHRGARLDRQRPGGAHRMTGRLGALAERNFRLVFTSTTISALGDGVSTIALAFAVLQISNSPAALGAVIAARQVANAAITLAAGVFADRLPRHLVLVAAACVQGTVQAVSAVLVLTGHATVPALAGLALVYGLADGFVIP